MGQVLHGMSRDFHPVDENPGDWPRRLRQSVRCPAGDCAAIAERGAIQNSEESLRALSARYGSEADRKTIQ